MNPTTMTLDVDLWVNSPAVELSALRGRVVLIEAFQMLCPGCVSHGLPQAQRVHEAFDRDDVVVLGLHTVFEHHEFMSPGALAAFVFEYRLSFPIAVDRPVEGVPLPATMTRYALRGTPTTLLVDRAGYLRHSILGALDDLTLGVHLGRLLSEPAPTLDAEGSAPIASRSGGSCTPDGCN